MFFLTRGARTGLLFSMTLLFAPAYLTTAFAEGPTYKVEAFDPDMVQAFAKARAGLDHFLAIWRNRPAGAEGFSVKIGLRDTPGDPGYAIVQPLADPPGPVEWFWTRNLRTEGDGFVAEINNDAEDLHNISAGQTIHFVRADIGDWMYQQNGKIIGNATACPALAHATPEVRRQMKEQFGLGCE
jgi:uncharacterized protein YegJ (DUF2314 family)